MERKAAAYARTVPEQAVDQKVRELPLDIHLKPPYASTYEKNYVLHAK